MKNVNSTTLILGTVAATVLYFLLLKYQVPQPHTVFNVALLVVSSIGYVFFLAVAVATAQEITEAEDAEDALK